jgi:hypothetical protein
MKARIATVFATAIVALAVAGGALAAPHQNTIRGWSHSPAGLKAWNAKGWDYTRPGTVKIWNIKPWQIKGWALKPNPSGARGGPTSLKPNPTCARGGATAS